MFLSIIQWYYTLLSTWNWSKIGSLPPLARLALLGAVLESLLHAVVGGVLAPVLKPEEGSTLAGENIGHPAEGVIEIPDGDTDAALDLDASANSLLTCISMNVAGKGRKGA